MNRNYNFNDYDLPPENVCMQHMPVIIVCDTSGSMGVPKQGIIPIQNVNLSVNRFAADVCKDPKAAGLVDVAVISFNEEPTVVQGFRPITELQPVQFSASGSTNISSALELAISKMRERCNLYDENGIEIKMPYIILITDGYGGDVTEIAKVIKQRTAAHKMQLWILCVKGYDEETVAKLADVHEIYDENGRKKKVPRRVIELVNEDGYDFTEFFDLMAVSIKAVSTSSPDQRIHVDNPLEKEGTNLQAPDLDDWLNS